MNNIKLDEDYIILDDINLKNIENNKVYLISDNLLEKELIINIPDNYNVKFYLITKKNNFDIRFNQNNNTKLEFFFSIKTNNKSSYKVYNTIDGNSNISLIRGRVYNSKNADTVLDVSGDVSKNTYDNIYTEDIRGLKPYNNNLLIIPNLLVSSSEVEANHLASISNLFIDDLLYLMQKGIDEKNARKLLTDAFLYGIFPSNIKK